MIEQASRAGENARGAISGASDPLGARAATRSMRVLSLMALLLLVAGAAAAAGGPPKSQGEVLKEMVFQALNLAILGHHFRKVADSL